jgi:hypothetical protein
MTLLVLKTPDILLKEICVPSSFVSNNSCIICIISFPSTICNECLKFMFERFLLLNPIVMNSFLERFLILIVLPYILTTDFPKLLRRLCSHPHF